MTLTDELRIGDEMILLTATEKAVSSNELISDMHTMFDCTLTYKGTSQTFPYQCSLCKSEPTVKDVLTSLFADMNYYEQSPDEFMFLVDFCYNENRQNMLQGREAYKTCKETYSKLHKLFLLQGIHRGLYHVFF